MVTEETRGLDPWTKQPLFLERFPEDSQQRRGFLNDWKKLPRAFDGEWFEYVKY